MATLQVKRVPDDLYVAAKARAESEGVSLSELVLRLLQRELSLPSLKEWLSELPTPDRVVEVDIQALMDEVRGTYE